MNRTAVSFLPTIPYPEIEKPKLAVLEKLFQAWHHSFDSALSPKVADAMVFDGFYPHYFGQRKRVLFIAWESRQISGRNYLDVLYPSYRKTKRIGRTRHLNQDKFHSRLIRIAWGINHGMKPWQEVPPASVIGDSFGAEHGLSFAFMNVSKLSNESDRHTADRETINTAYRLSTHQRNFVSEEVAAFEPHIVITMNLQDKLAALGSLTRIEPSGAVRSFWLESGGHRSLLIDGFHFAARKKAAADFYEPICEAIRRSESNTEH